MRPISLKIRKHIDRDPYYKRCARANGECQGRITMEHSLTYAGRQLDEIWAIIPLCIYHHLGAGLNKRINEKLALERATDEDLAKYPKKNWAQLRKYLQTV